MLLDRASNPPGSVKLTPWVVDVVLPSIVTIRRLLPSMKMLSNSSDHGPR